MDESLIGAQTYYDRSVVVDTCLIILTYITDGLQLYTMMAIVRS